MLNDQTTPVPADADALAADAAAPTPAAPATDDGSAAQLEQLLVLSQSPLSLEDALQQEADREDDVPAVLTAGGLLKRFGALVVLFLGVGLVTAAVRHYSDAPKIYLGAALGGAVLFAIASVVLEPRARRGSMVDRLKFGALSGVLGLGFGLLVGGVLHFTAFPHTGAVLVPLGLALSIGAFLARDGHGLVRRDVINAGVTIAGLLVWLGVGLGLAAKKIDPSPTTPAAAHGAPAGDHGAPAADGHGAAAEGEHGAAAEGDHGAAAAKDEHGAAAKGEHGATAAKAEHGAAAEGDHGAAAKADHGAAADAGHGATEAKADSHATEATADGHATETKAADSRGAEAKADHGAAASGHGEAAPAKAEEEEDEVTAADVLVPRKKH